MVLLDLDPAKVPAPGWIPLLLTLAALVAVALLFLSMRKHLGRITSPDDPAPESDAQGTDSGTRPAAAGPVEAKDTRPSEADKGQGH